MSKGFDCATKLTTVTAKLLKAAGFDYVARYLGNSWKTFDAAEAKAIHDAGLNLISIFEKNSTYVGYFTKSQGIADAKEAEQYAKAAGQPTGTAIYFTVDYNAQSSHMGAIKDYLAGVKETIKDYKIGLYGSYSVINAMKDMVDYHWQTYAWSGGKVADFIHMHQYENGVSVSGISLDRNDIKKDPGHWGKVATVKASSTKTVVKKVSVPDSYTVKKGDTLSEIGAKYGLDYHDLKTWNGLKSDTIYPGQKLKLKKPTTKAKTNGKAIVPYPGHLIKNGSTGKDVIRIQNAVGVTADGLYGAKTEAAVKAYQKRHGLAVDGIVGPDTWNVMF
ncbi:glycoside hydrolase domain-containing protein [Heyndrickxia ginsengihumi]|uniref:glycoside hydrolase domain-containing protein n=1 Tax=Heyndrickxia ginsengihumi TaxID=363870 RepID=UPI00068AB40E|nr:glycoside hydrolase domain-containing protein [Heyndrickxia ginsengihumi]